MKARGLEGKKGVALLFIVLMLSSAPYAKEVKNTLGAVKSAKQGDYITLVGGHRYVLVDAEIEAVKGGFDYDDAALKQNEVPRSDEGVEYNITSAHKKIVWQDDKEMDILTTTRSFDGYISCLASQYDVIPFIKNGKEIGSSFPAVVPDELQTFRGKVYHTFVTEGGKTYDYIDAKEYNRTQGKGVQRCYQRKGGDLAADVSGDEVVIGSKAHLAEHQNETVPKTNDFDEIMSILNFGDEVSEFVCIYAKQIEELTLLDCADKDISTAAKKAYQGLLKEVSTWSRDSEAITRKTIDYHVDIKLYMVSRIDSLRYKATNMACYFIMATGPAFLKYKDNKGNKNDDSASFLNNCTSAISHHRFEYDKDAIKELASDPLYRKAIMAFKQ